MFHKEGTQSLGFVRCLCFQVTSWEPRTQAKSLHGAPATKSSTGGCTSGASDWTITGWKTHVCHAQVCVTADPGYFLEKTTASHSSLHCRGRRDPCCHSPHVTKRKDIQVTVGQATVTVEMPEEVCIDVRAEGKKEKGVRGRGECWLTVQQVPS